MATRNLGGSLEGEATCLRKLVGFVVVLHKLYDTLQSQGPINC